MTERSMKKKHCSFKEDAKVVRRRWGRLSRKLLDVLEFLTTEHHLSVLAGDLQLLDNHWYVTHSGLLRLARRSGCLGILTAIDRLASSPSDNRWVFKATVYTTSHSKGFVGYGDADPSTTSSVVRGAEMRVAETRAVNRALRKAYGIGLCSVEELGLFSTPQRPLAAKPYANGYAGSSGLNGQPRLRDQLCLLIRDYQLDPTLVKAYAADFCGTATLSGASRELVESFISHLAVAAKENRDGLVCKLNSYARPSEVQP